ncbi:MAG: hypothetical protein GPJ54_15755 [Candidatus Heimdallarchaeota archaeon]|nr:hypothetical protein [Candidatus Heimdallarchaeota archaeon]
MMTSKMKIKLIGISFILGLTMILVSIPCIDGNVTLIRSTIGVYNQNTIISDQESEISLLPITMEQNYERNFIIQSVQYWNNFYFSGNYIDQNNSTGFEDIFIGKIIPESFATELIVTFGGMSRDISLDMVIDTHGNIVIVGLTYSNDLPVTSNNLKIGTETLFLAKFNNTGQLIFSTYFGTGMEYNPTIAIDKNDNIYLGSVTKSSDYPLLNEIDDSLNGITDIGFSKFTPDGELLYSTYIGGGLVEESPSIAIDNQNNVMLAFSTFSQDVTTQNAIYASNQGASDYFISKYTPSGNLLYATYLGGSSSDLNPSIDVDVLNNVYITGSTSSSDFPTLDSNLISFSGGYDISLSKLAPTGYLINSSIIGGGGAEEDPKLEIKDENILLVAETKSVDFPIIGGYDDTLNGDSDFIMIRFNLHSKLMASSYLGGSDFEFYPKLTAYNNDAFLVYGRSLSLDYPTTFNNELITAERNVITLIMDDTTIVSSKVLSGEDIVHTTDITYDNSGNIIQIGTTSSNYKLIRSDNPLNNFNGYLDVYITKSYPNGTEIWTKYIGGRKSEDLVKMVIDSENNIIAIGVTYSNDFPVLNYFDGISDGLFSDFFVMKISENGTSLFSTYLKGSWYENSPSVTIDTKDNIIIAGTTFSDDFPILNAQDNQMDGISDLILSKFDKYGNLIFSTYFGGSSAEDNAQLITDNEDNIYLTGNTTSIDLNVTNGEYSNYNGGGDAFIAKFNKLGELISNTYFGGSGMDNIVSIALNSENEVVFSGTTASENFPIKDAAFSTISGGFDIFLSKLYSSGQLQWSTFLGGSNNDFATQVIIINNDQIVLGGNTHSSDFPTVNAQGSNYNGNQDMVFTIFNLNGNYIFGSLLGGENRDSLNNIAFSGIDLFVISGKTESINLPLSEAKAPGVSQFTSIIYIGDPDSDQDNLTYFEEYHLGTDPQNNDTDKDGMDDGWEVLYKLNPLMDDSSNDDDNDGLINLEEYRLSTNPKISDTDDDGIPDGWEAEYGLNPLIDDASVDLDEDGLNNLNEYSQKTDPTNKDTDEDGMPDGWEVEHGLDPLQDDSDEDPDEDGIINIDEYRNNGNPNEPDKSNIEIWNYIIPIFITIIASMLLWLLEVKFKIFSKII